MAIWKLQVCILLVAALLSTRATGPVAPVGSSSCAPAREGDEQEIWVQGERLARELEGQGLIYDAPAFTAYVNQVGQKVVPPAAQTQMPFRFFALHDRHPNAFALPSGRIHISEKKRDFRSRPLPKGYVAWIIRVRKSDGQLSIEPLG